MWWSYINLSLIYFFVNSSRIAAETFVLGYLTGSQRRPGDFRYERPGTAISGAISYAIDQVNSELELNKSNHRLSFLVAETYGEEETSISETARLWRDNVSGYIGPQETCVHEARMASAFNLPMISYYCTQPETSDKHIFKTFARTRPSDTQISKSVAALLLTFHWYQVVFCYLEGGTTSRVAKTLLETFKEVGIKILETRNWYTPYQFPFSDSIFSILVEETYENARIYVILGTHDEHLGLLSAMEERRLLTSGNYFVVGVHLEAYNHENPTQYMRGILRPNIDPFIVDAFTGYFSVIPSSSVTFRNFSRIVNDYLSRPPFSFSRIVQRVIPPEAGYLYDAVLLYTKGLLKVLENGGDPRNGTAIIDAIKGVHYLSGRGYMSYIDQNGDAQGNYTLLARRNLPNHSDVYGLFPVGVFISSDNDSDLPILDLTEEIYWIKGSPPADEPPCGFHGEKCINHTWQKVGIVTGALTLIFVIVSLVFYRNWRYEQELDSLLWKVDFRDIQISEEDNGESPAKMTRASHPLIRTSQVSLSSNPDTDFRYSAIFTTIGIYRGRVLAVKRVRKRSIDITRSMKKELKLMRDLRHENLNPFIGACTDAPNICIISEYCARGSLKDILDNDDVKLDNMFVASLVSDIIRGMIFLHESPIRSHGHLKTSNCLVDPRWVLKIADYGLHEFKRGEEIPNDEVSVAKRLQGLLYCAPELLRFSNVDEESNGSQKGDIYSFGIILYELHTRQGPFGENTLTSNEILEKLKKKPEFGEKPFRPPLEPLESSFDFVRECLKECWNEIPDQRPDFKTIRAKLRPMKKGMKPNIFDNMMSMMEKYTNNLEALVDERTDQLVVEKKKTEALLYEMLPRPVAEQLKKGNKVEAENYDSVTIYFSDIVGFTAMSAESTPLQIVDFLNDLYTCFDSIVENYDVYKVETIGDAYMVVSGLPIRNGKDHAGEIASMSLHLVREVQKFRIKHRPSEPLLLRIGIHSGPVCAGVVGLKMPRYCLFGDTVNTASRMESNGQPGRIHCSSSTKELLDHLGGYYLEKRGFVPMKGKGDQLTYWLKGEDENIRKERRKTENADRDLKNGPRSSLKPKKHDQCRNPIARCSSLESSKKIRFASADLLEFPRSDLTRDPLLETVSDASPIKNLLEVCSNHEQLRRTSSSCPCIEHFAESCSAVHQALTNNASTSVPMLANFQKNIQIYIDPDDANLQTPLLNTSNN